MKIGFRIALALLPLACQIAGASVQAADPSGGKGDLRVVPNGPVHEAFAQPQRLPLTPPTVTQAPPKKPLIEEIPSEKPDLEGVQWIPGYWDYSPNDNDYVWVSGVWRVPPPDRQWVNGYWNEDGGKWRRVRGYWADYRPSGADPETSYLPAPPRPKKEERGEPSETGSVYIPGSWVWSTPVSNYTWQSGYWTKPQPGWTWTPRTYIWTPGGYVPSGGFWDYPPARRGVAFAPVSVPPSVRTVPGYQYVPSQVVRPVAFTKLASGGASDPARFTYNNATFTSYNNAPWVKRVPLSPAVRSELNSLVTAVRQSGRLRKTQEAANGGPPKAPRRVKLSPRRPRPGKKVTPPQHPNKNKVVRKGDPRKIDNRPGNPVRRKTPTGVTRKPGVKKPVVRTPNRNGGKKPSGNVKKGPRKNPKGNLGKGKKKGPKKKAGNSKKKPKKKAGKGKKKGPKKKAGKSKKKPKKKAGKGKKKPKKKAHKSKKKPKKKAGKNKKKGKKKGGKKR